MIAVRLYLRIRIRERRTFTREFKLNAVELSYSRENILELTHELKIRLVLLCRWRSEFASNQGAGFPGKGNPKITDEEKNSQFAKRIAGCKKMERDMQKGNQHQKLAA